MSEIKEEKVEEKAEDVDSWDYEKILQEREDQFNRRRVIRYLIQAVKYLYSYLIEFPFEIIPNFTDNPVSLTIRIYWTKRDILEFMDDGTYLARIEKLERELKKVISEGLESKAPNFEQEKMFERKLNIGKLEVYPKIPETIEDNRAGELITSPNVSNGNKKLLKRRRVVEGNAF